MTHSAIKHFNVTVDGEETPVDAFLMGETQLRAGFCDHRNPKVFLLMLERGLVAEVAAPLGDIERLDSLIDEAISSGRLETAIRQHRKS